MRIDCIFLHKDMGILKHDMAYDGIAEKTALSITCLPASDKKQDDQLCGFCLIMSTIDVKISRLRRPKYSGKPKYFPAPLSWLIRSSRFALLLLDRGVFEANVMEDFVKFIDWPNAFLLTDKILLRALQLGSSDLQKIWYHPRIRGG